MCGERWGTRAGEKMTAGPCSEGGFESFLSVYIQKNVLHITIFNAFRCFTFLSDPNLLKLHALGALLWDVKNEKS